MGGKETYLLEVGYVWLCLERPREWSEDQVYFLYLGLLNDRVSLHSPCLLSQQGPHDNDRVSFNMMKRVKGLRS